MIRWEPDSGYANPLNYHRTNRWSDLNFKLQKFMLMGNFYQKTVHENQLGVTLENECEWEFIPSEFIPFYLPR